MFKKAIDIVGVQMDLGAATRGVAMGPMAIRYGGICNGLRELGYEVHDKGDIIQLPEGATKDTLRNYEQVLDVNNRLYHSVEETLKAGHFPVILGGDHSIAAGSISAVSKHYKNIGIIWIDAHGDWNDEESSPSGNMHGMPFSAVCGHGPECMVDFGQGPVYVEPRHCVQIGGRDIDTMERVRMKEAGVTVFPINVIDKLGMEEVIRRAIHVAGTGTEGIHLSFDVDAITPEAAPGTGTIVHSGLTVREAFLAVETLAESEKLLAIDMVEVNPILDERNKTGILASELVQSCLGKVVY
ncbi:MAG: arginase [Firmicutes bacterium]|nr:arginase [Bacillota bacterium]